MFNTQNGGTKRKNPDSGFAFNNDKAPSPGPSTGYPTMTREEEYAQLVKNLQEAEARRHELEMRQAQHTADVQRLMAERKKMKPPGRQGGRDTERMIKEIRNVSSELEDYLNS
ncbi:hypothetical protein VKT23_013720 [Stygiomarasmius scandens]|uniref:Uncharacterized protein n=1 Tax=Marasmiellus scandens TaxID=2682957 RepID=A0ABR1J3K8_9AGAR